MQFKNMGGTRLRKAITLDIFPSSDRLNSIGKKLKIGDVAVDPSPLGTEVTLPTLSAPWNNFSYLASDTGDSVKGKHIRVYVGEGKVTGKNDAAKALKYLKANSPINQSITVCYL
jgi:3D (Asp-Asp-Asp) domain-containing protein